MIILILKPKSNPSSKQILYELLLKLFYLHTVIILVCRTASNPMCSIISTLFVAVGISCLRSSYPHRLENFDDQMFLESFARVHWIRCLFEATMQRCDNHNVLSKDSASWPRCGLNPDYAIKVVVKIKSSFSGNAPTYFTKSNSAGLQTRLNDLNTNNKKYEPTPADKQSGL